MYDPISVKTVKQDNVPVGSIEKDSAAKLIEAAAETVRGLIDVASDKPNDHQLKSDARSFRGLALMIEELSKVVREQENRLDRQTDFFNRIANLKVRSAQGLIEAGRWKDITAQLQAIALDALSDPNRRKSEIEIK